jgi:hypothetical protein
MSATTVAAWPSPVTLPHQSRTAIDVAALLQITDPWHRSQLAHVQVRQLEAQVDALRTIRRDAVGELVNQHRTPLAKVAAHLALTKGRIGQLAKAALRGLDGGDAR